MKAAACLEMRIPWQTGIFAHVQHLLMGEFTAKHHVMCKVFACCPGHLYIRICKCSSDMAMMI